ncbi:MAG: DUF4091 domain-containing protein [Clostridia bacterium]|nr:DUF4091 domain-containing protein [Clostridia bacterium]
MQSTITNGNHKFTRTDALPDVCRLEYELYLAKNEGEGCQIVLYSAEDRELTFMCTAGEGLDPAVFEEYTVPAAGLDYPDPLVPLQDTVRLTAGETRVLYIRFTATADTPAGTYIDRFVLQNKDKTEAEYTIRAHVWDFVLPETPACATAFGINREFIPKLHDSDGAETDRLYRAYYDLLLDHRISAYDIPYDLLDPRADAYLNDPRMTSFRVPLCLGDDDHLAQIYAKLCTNPVWLKKAMFYPVDEPSSPELLEKLKRRVGRLKKLAPEIRICTPYYSNIQVDDERDQTMYMTGVTDLWCPQSPLFVTSNFYTKYQWEHYPPYPERMLERKAAGDGLWWYVCWGPRDPYCNMFVDQQTLKHRILFWQQYMQQVDGFLYWSVNYWEGITSPWEDIATVKFLSPDVFGDGSMVYPGRPVGIDGPCSSIRLEAVRDGVEDFAYLKLAEERFGREWVLEQVHRVTTGMIEYTADADLFEAVRKRIGEAISQK